ncbi:MAG: hypothetical protein FXF47_05000 [Candidatus Mcinerneyibacterium aminivorans]|uniref:Lipoprotein n=1 Tax=Candidatus Mcinerneyibacterium aminivorans TaxID=2703815 RepID=A0A5D0MH92_9BACT|nr:MAG: hypothetical protein FXF47_05000 [Candidatus Mcinerneyibacterium aminivorans]
MKKFIFFILFFIMACFPLTISGTPSQKENSKSSSSKNIIQITSNITFNKATSANYMISIKISGPFSSKMRDRLLKKTKEEIKGYIKNLVSTYLKTENKVSNYKFKNLTIDNSKDSSFKIDISGKFSNIKWINEDHILIHLPILSLNFLKKVNTFFILKEKTVIGSNFSKKFSLRYSPDNRKIRRNNLFLSFSFEKMKHNYYILKEEIKLSQSKNLNRQRNFLIQKLNNFKKDFLIFYYE